MATDCLDSIFAPIRVERGFQGADTVNNVVDGRVILVSESEVVSDRVEPVHPAAFVDHIAFLLRQVRDRQNLDGKEDNHTRKSRPLAHKA
jgi:hypothetical protein